MKLSMTVPLIFLSAGCSSIGIHQAKDAPAEPTQTIPKQSAPMAGGAEYPRDRWGYYFSVIKISNNDEPTLVCSKDHAGVYEMEEMSVHTRSNGKPGRAIKETGVVCAERATQSCNSFDFVQDRALWPIEGRDASGRCLAKTFDNADIDRALATFDEMDQYPPAHPRHRFLKYSMANSDFRGFANSGDRARLRDVNERLRFCSALRIRGFTWSRKGEGRCS